MAKCVAFKRATSGRVNWRCPNPPVEGSMYCAECKAAALARVASVWHDAAARVGHYAEFQKAEEIRRLRWPTKA
jgi:hypothetical protein